jgi:Pyruvate/2-oxoacid:ferredoxin oxidoreductase delta subunit
VFTPGITGSACLLIALMLALKGYSVRGIQGLDMPSNWQQVHSGFRPASVDAILARTEPRARSFAIRILDGGLHWLVPGTFYDLVWGLSMLPLSLLYLPMGRLVFAKMFHASNRCNACGQCETFCPVGGVKLVGKDRPMPYWTYHCESCNRCFSFCPRKAVEISYPWFWILTILSVVPLVAFRWPPALAAWVVTPPGVATLVVVTILYWYLLAFAGYALFALCMRVRWLNTLFVYTNLAHLWRRYRAPGARLKRMGVRKRSPLARTEPEAPDGG